MGSHRLSRWAFILMPLFAFGDFGVSDSATLNQIAIDVAHAANASQGADSSLVYIRSDTAYLADVVYDAQQNLDVMQGYLYRLSNTGLRSVTNALWGIFDKLETDYQHHNIGNTTSSFLSIYTHDVRTDDIYSRLGDLQDSINNLTNYFCYSPEYVAGASAIYTNFPALFAYITGSDPSDALANSYLALWRLLGREPTEQEARLFDNASSNGLGSWLALLLQLGYSWDDLPDNLKSLANQLPYSNEGPYPFYGDFEDSTAIFTQLRYYQYGTRELTDIAIGISNVVANITNQLFDIESGGFFEPDSTPGSHGFRFAPVVKEGVQSVMDDAFFTEEPSTNIVGNIDTNNILAIADNSYKTDLDRLKASTPQDFTELDGVLSEINTASGAIESVADALSQDHNGNYILRLPFSMPAVGSVDLSLTLDNMTASTTPIVNLICHFLQIAIGLYFFRIGWSKVVATVNFHNEPDPF